MVALANWLLFICKSMKGLFQCFGLRRERTSVKNGTISIELAAIWNVQVSHTPLPGRGAVALTKMKGTSILIYWWILILQLETVLTKSKLSVDICIWPGQIKGIGAPPIQVIFFQQSNYTTFQMLSNFETKTGKKASL